MFKLLSSLFVLFFVYIFVVSQDLETNELDGVRACTVLSNHKTIGEAVKKLQLPDDCDEDGQLQVVCCPQFADTSAGNETEEAEDEEPELDATDLENLDTAKAERISSKKCRDYSRVALFDEVSTLASTTMVDSCALRVESYTSGKSEIELKFMSQPKDVLPKEVPHMAAIGYLDASGVTKWQCEGALISDSYIVTAGHCLNHSIYGEPKFVRLGDLDLAKKYKSEKYAKTFDISETLPFPTYQTDLQYDDVGLIKLNGKVSFNAHIRPACLPTENHDFATKVIASGYKRSDDADRNPTRVVKVLLEKFDLDECNEAYPPTDLLPRGIEPEYQFCAGSRKTTSDFCQNDSGAPLQIFHPSQYCIYSLVGVASFGNSCGEVGSPSVYIKLYSYLNWIESAIWG